MIDTWKKFPIIKDSIISMHLNFDVVNTRKWSLYIDNKAYSTIGIRNIFSIYMIEKMRISFFTRKIINYKYI